MHGESKGFLHTGVVSFHTLNEELQDAVVGRDLLAVSMKSSQMCLGCT